MKKKKSPPSPKATVDQSNTEKKLISKKAKSRIISESYTGAKPRSAPTQVGATTGVKKQKIRPEPDTRSDSRSERKEIKEEEKKEIWATGKRKTAVAIVKLKPKGKGEIVINKKFTLEKYFPWFAEQQTILSPLEIINKKKDFDVEIKTKGGGKKAQAEAIRLGLAKTLSFFNENWRDDFKKLGFLTRDSRVKERKKPGLKKARRAPQWHKR